MHVLRQRCQVSKCRRYTKTCNERTAMREELFAELDAAFLCTNLELTPEVRTDHAAYIQSWLKVLKEDKRVIFSAAAHAQRAADFLHGCQPSVEEERQGAAA
ncbi:zincin-like metallopeptidase domain-containing protein [Roseobacter weihaiensis]|uniref:zincin-like metallopeptidase domain-containing protein n=1 Tax=Roseobacter weihaiensis TaxID=2763262 RepID=UPI0029CAB366|nr:zincin-like metallopeptidase domain-containing protein [Roseobacter sp. H9]